MDDTHECPRDGCTRRIPSGRLMCPQDWYAVPGPLRKAVWAAWRHGAGRGGPEHRAAIRAAINALNERSAP